MPHIILYLDDDATQLEVFREIFGDRYDVRIATNIAEARRVLADCAPDIIISDQKMPEMEGTEFLDESKTVCPDSFRVLLTGAITVGEVLPQVGAGIVNLFIPKPWSEEDMRLALERAIASLRMGGGRKGRAPRASGKGGKRPLWLIMVGL